MEYLEKKMVEYPALRHDVVLVHKDFMSKFDLKDLSAHDRENAKIHIHLPPSYKKSIKMFWNIKHSSENL
jgi:hypothetical protein